jgi:DNA replication and repair protein RecF
LKEHLGVLPILLLDDIFDKLDHTRVERLMKLVANNYFGQVLVTDTDAQRVQTIFGESDLKATIFSVEDGKVEQLIESEAI